MADESSFYFIIYSLLFPYVLSFLIVIRINMKLRSWVYSVFKPKKNGILEKLIHCKLKLLMFSAVVVRECHIHLRMIFSVVDVKNNLQLKAFVLKKEISKLKIIFFREL